MLDRNYEFIIYIINILIINILNYYYLMLDIFNINNKFFILKN